MIFNSTYRNYFSIFLFFTLAIATFAATNSISIACVDKDKVFERYYKTLILQKKIFDQGRVYDKHVEKKQEELRTLNQSIKKLEDESLNVFFTEELRTQKREAAKQRKNILVLQVQELNKFIKEKQLELEQKRRKKATELSEEIDKQTVMVAKEKGYDLVIDKRMVFYLKEDLDISELLIKRLNKGHEKEIEDLEKALKKAINNAKNPPKKQ